MCPPPAPEIFWRSRTGAVTLYRGDCRAVLPALRGEYAGAIDLLLTDPPFSRVKSDAWDRLNHSELSNLLGGVFADCVPLMRRNATVYCFCWPHFADRLSGLMRDYFAVLGSIIWCKRRPGGKLNGKACQADISALRVPFCETERIIMGEMAGADASAAGEAGYHSACDAAFARVMAPLIAYFVAAKTAAGITSGEIQERMAALTGKRYVFARHTFSASQWKFPTAEQYAAARTFLPGLTREYEDLRREYEDLRREYEDLRREYEDLRRYYVPRPENFTDLWFYQPVGPGAPGRVHPCQKPLDMLRDMIATSCRPGGLLLDPFGGSCSLGVAALQTGRRALLVERDADICATAARVLADADATLF